METYWEENEDFPKKSTYMGMLRYIYNYQTLTLIKCFMKNKNVKSVRKMVLIRYGLTEDIQKKITKFLKLFFEKLFSISLQPRSSNWVR